MTRSADVPGLEVVQLSERVVETPNSPCARMDVHKLRSHLITCLDETVDGPLRHSGPQRDVFTCAFRRSSNIPLRSCTTYLRRFEILVSVSPSPRLAWRGSCHWRRRSSVREDQHQLREFLEVVVDWTQVSASVHADPAMVEMVARE